MKSSHLEDRLNPTAWDELLRMALPMLDHVFGTAGDLPPEQAENEPPAWTLGGGTALALRMGHRLSDDVDIFVPGKKLKLFTPAMNPAAKAIGAKVQWPGSYLKFECPKGEIDLLSPVLQTEPGYTIETYRGRRIALETTDEVIVKKIRYRSGKFTSRDIFDLAAVGRVDRNVPELLASEVADVLPGLRAVIEARQRAPREMGRHVRPTPAFRDLLTEAYVEACDLIDKAQGRDHPRPGRRRERRGGIGD